MFSAPKMALGAGIILASACGGSSTPTTPTTPGGCTASSTLITITATGTSPRNVQVAVGARVCFFNNDGRSHNMTSDPHPEHDTCPALNDVGFLSPGQRRETANLVQARTCGYHDHDNPAVVTLQGQIVIQ